MKRYKNIFNLVALTIVLVFFALMFSTATPDKTSKAKEDVKVELKEPMIFEKPLSEVLYPPKSPFEEVRYDK